MFEQHALGWSSVNRAATAFDGLLPAAAVVVEATSPMWEAGLWPEEQAHVARAVEKRVREFTAGRNCARQALESLGIPPRAIPVGPSREPVFPPGVSGTITHTSNYCAAAVIRTGEVRSIGIDAGSNVALASGLLTKIAGTEECTMLEVLSSTSPPTHWDMLLFCIKEAFYKAYFQLHAQFLDFHEASVVIDPSTSSFVVRVKQSEVEYFRERAFPGAFSCGDRLLLAAVALCR
jgi:4'-phosphopantetheinyl transferase EntD